MAFCAAAVVTLENTASFAKGYSFGCAYVQKASTADGAVPTLQSVHSACQLFQ